MIGKSSFAYVLALSLLSAGSAVAAEKVAIGMSTGVNQVATVVGKAKGYFAEEGIDVDLKPVNRGAIAIEAVAGGSIQFAESSHTSFFSAVAKGLPLEGVGVVSRGFFGRMIASNANADLKTLEDFKGKRVGTQVGTGMHMVIEMLLEKKGLTDESLGISNVRVNDMPAAMATGDTFDAVIGWDPAMERIVQSGYGKEVISTGDFMELAGITYPFILSTTSDYLKANPDTVQGVVNAYAKAHKFITSNPDEALKIYYEYLKTTGAELDEPTVKQMMFDVERFGGVAFTDADWQDLPATTQYLLKQGRIKTALDLDKIIHRDIGEKAEAAVK
jgi:ABC-type nitrate/sulfonate/bicarbonate transport system substrate-binding protein